MVEEAAALEPGKESAAVDRGLTSDYEGEARLRLLEAAPRTPGHQ